MTPTPPTPDRKEVSAWALLLLAAVIAGASVVLFWWVARLHPGDRVFGRPVTETGGRITRLSLLLEEPENGNLAGRDVSLDQVPVQSVVGDTSFWIGSGDRRVFVVLWGELTERQPEGATEVDAGEMVALQGRVLLLDPWMIRALPSHFSPEERRALEQERIFIRADLVQPSSEASESSGAPPSPPRRGAGAP